MVCCKADKYGGWCKDLATPSGIDGKMYCEFHLPKDGWAGAGVESFNELVFERVQAAIAGSDCCYLSGTIFPGAISFKKFDQDNPLPAMNLIGAIFLSCVDFRNCCFNGTVDFSTSTFKDTANFGNTTFNNFVDFVHCRFSGWAIFSRSSFIQQVGFDDCTFKGQAIFRSSVFLEIAGFNASKFSDRADFLGCKFEKGVRFGGSTFSNLARFSAGVFRGRTDFCNCAVKANIFFEKSTFWGYTDFGRSSFAERADFSRGDFKDIVTFYGCTFSSEAIFDNTKFGEKTVFRSLTTYGAITILLREVDFAKCSVTFLETDLTSFRFERCDWPQKGSSPSIFGTASILYDEQEAESNFKNVKLWDRLFSYPKFSESYVMVGDLYRQLKQQYKERHNEAEASKWHFREKEMFRKRNVWRRYFPLSFSNLYRFSSGYGEAPMLAGIVLLGLLASCTLLMNYLGIISSDGLVEIKGFSVIPDWSKVWQISQNTIQYALFVKIPDFDAITVTGKTFLLLFSRLLIPIQATLFVFALRNKFRR